MRAVRCYNVFMKKFRIGKILFFVSLSVIIVLMFAMILVGGLTDDLPDWTAIMMLGGFFVFAALLIASLVLISGDAEVGRSRRKYKKLPCERVEDYKSEIETMRKNYADDNAADKNTVPKPMNRKFFGYLDFRVLKRGKIYYGYLVEANNLLFRRNYGFMGNSLLPAVMLYSTDPYYDENPLELKYVAEQVFADRNNNVLRDESKYFSNIKLTNPICGERAVYMTTLMIYRPQLPEGYISDGLIPLIADPDCSSAFVLEHKYWSDKFARYFAGCDKPAKVLDMQLEEYRKLPQGEVDYAAALQGVKEKFYAEMNKYEAKDEKPFGELGGGAESEYKLFYACVVAVNKKLNNPLNKKELIPAVIIYGKGDRFINNPAALKSVAGIISGISKEEKRENFRRAIDYRRHSIGEVRVPNEWTEGEEVYLTGALLRRGHLPGLCVCDSIMPVVQVGEDGLIHSVHKDFWTEELISAYVRGEFKCAE